MGQQTDLGDLLALTSFREMVRRKNVAEVKSFMNNTKNIQSFLKALGMDKKFLDMPAHREQIEKCFNDMMKTISEGIRSGDVDLKVKYLEHGIEVHEEGFKIGETSKLEFRDGLYTYERTRNLGEISRKIKGSIKENKIATATRGDGYYATEHSMLNVKDIDECGFVISQSTELSNGAKDYIKRNGIFITSGEEEKIKWDGNAFELNEKSTNAKTFLDNMLYTIDKYPKSQGYYENIVGKDFVSKALETVKEKN